jgi:hypothetical protein
MVQVLKKEWHQVTSISTLDVDQDILGEIYPDESEEELTQILENLDNESMSIDDIIDAARENNVDLAWDHIHDDWWTDRKGGYDITYEIDRG